MNECSAYVGLDVHKDTISNQPRSCHRRHGRPNLRLAAVPPDRPHPPMSAEYPGIPCGRARFKGIRRVGSLHADRTSFIRPLERLKYVKRDAGEARLDAGRDEAMSRLRRHLADEGLHRQRPEVAHTGVAVVLHGRELARRDPVDGTEQAHGP